MSSPIAIPVDQLAIQISQTGGPEVIKLNKILVPQPADDELLIKVEWCGVCLFILPRLSAKMLVSMV